MVRRRAAGGGRLLGIVAIVGACVAILPGLVSALGVPANMLPLAAALVSWVSGKRLLPLVALFIIAVDMVFLNVLSPLALHGDPTPLMTALAIFGAVAIAADAMKKSPRNRL